MVKGLIGSLVVLTLVLTAGLLIRSDREELSINSLSQPETTAAAVAKKTVIAVKTPAPLRHEQQTSPGNLSIAGILEFTNAERHQQGQSALSLNPLLTQAAQNKVADMFNQQYFEHISPQGMGPAELVAATGYTYLVAGENLALGPFQDDQSLVQAWMDSPGHRANILSADFLEIGVAVQQGQFENKEVWLAVQTFATPLSVCPTPDPTAETIVEEAQKEINQQSLQLAQRKQHLTQTRKELAVLAQEIEVKMSRANQHISRGNELIKQGNEAARSGKKNEAEELWEKGETQHALADAILEEIKPAQLRFEAESTTLTEDRHSYNEQVERQVELSQQLKQQVDQLNRQINLFNQCLEQST